MKNNLQHIFQSALSLSKLIALIFCFSLSSCELEETSGNSNGDNGYIEFVARPIGFNNKTVETKSVASDFEKTIQNCFFLVFDANSGNRVGIQTINPTLTTTPKVRLDIKNLTQVYACFIANVPQETAYNIIGLTKPADAPNTENNKYLNSAVLDITYAETGVIGTPSLDLDNESTTARVDCIPMFGMTEEAIDLSTTSISTAIQIPIKRLFAKITVNLDIDFSGTVAGANYYKLISYKISNIPKKVSFISPDKLPTPKSDSDWVADTDPASFIEVTRSNINENLYNATDTYTFTFYVPEYYLTALTLEEYKDKGNAEATYEEQKYKPKKFDETKKPILITLNGSYNPINVLNEQKKSMRHLVYLGENSSTSFTLKRNVHYTNLLTIKGVNNNDADENNLDHRVIIDETYNAVDIYGESANCYIINEARSYVFPAVKGAHKTDLSQLTARYRCTQENAYLTVVSSTNNIEPKITNLRYDKAKSEFSFSVSEVVDGNAVIALAYIDENDNNKEKYEWSWHFWFDQSATVLNQKFFGLGTEKMPDNTTELINRNIGTSPSWLQSGVPGIALDGTYYRYGRKEPFFNNEYQGGGVILDSNGNEETGWNNTKSPTDPCPPGYRVPHSTVWSGNATKEHASIPLIGDAFRYWDNNTNSTVIYTDDIYYPYSGYVDSNGEIQSQGYGSRATTQNYAVNIPSQQTNLGYDDAANYTDGGIGAIAPNNKTGPVKFTNVTYSKYDILNLGVLAAQDKEIRYYFEEKGTDIISCKIEIGKWKRSGGILSGYKYTADYNSSGGPKELTGTQLKSEHETAYNRLISVINGGNGSNSESFWDAISGYFKNPTSNFTQPDINTSNGYQVRCVKE